MDKKYIEKEYDQAIKEYNAALTEDDLDTSHDFRVWEHPNKLYLSFVGQIGCLLSYEKT